MLVIVGAGQAAARLIEHLRAGGYDEPITLIGEEEELPYERPALSKGVLSGQVHTASLVIHNQQFYERASVSLLLGERVAQVDVDDSCVRLANGTKIGFTHCVLATGSRARRLPQCATEGGVVVLRTVKDAQRLAHLLTGEGQLLVVGGGFLGLEAATSARELGLEVTVVHAGPYLLNRVLPPSIAAELAREHAARGIHVITQAELTGLKRVPVPADGWSYRAEWADGKTTWADIVLEAVGGIANDELARAAGLEVANGIVCDSQCRTTAPNVLAIGDCARVWNIYDGSCVRLESWQAAESHAVVAANTLLGKSSGFNEVPWFWTDQAGFNLQLLGAFTDGQRLVTRELPGPKRSWMTFGLDGEGRVKAAALMNAGKHRRSVEDVIRQKVPVPESVLQDSAVPLKSIALQPA